RHRRPRQEHVAPPTWNDAHFFLLSQLPPAEACRDYGDVAPFYLLAPASGERGNPSPTDLPALPVCRVRSILTLQPLAASSFPAALAGTCRALESTVSAPDCLTWLREARRLLTALRGPQTGIITVTIHNEQGQGLEFLLPPDDNGR